ncbi:hypothetical protein [Romboutsia weinsteinii]|uniref:hypothetical protein n=1 Tax=Romboutsia weinsteinii TaxID=2020949 RepID=UPI000B96E044|nr:hypothetical protein [Romboutsia weinsteinii]
MGSKRKFKRDYIILEAKDANFRYKERVLPKAFAKVEVNDDKSVVALYVENLKHMRDGYRVVAIQSDYETIDLGKIVLSEQGKGEFVLDLEKDDVDIKGVALLYEKTVPLIGFKGSKIDNYEDILFMGEEDEYVDMEDEDEYEEYEEIEYIEVDDDEYEDGDEYEEIEYIEVEEDDDDYDYEDNHDEYEEDIEDDREVEPARNEYCRAEQYTEPRQNKFTNTNNEQINKEKVNREKAKQVQYKPKQPQYSRQQATQEIDQQSSYQSYQMNNHNNMENKKTPGALLMPRQIKKGLKHFREVKPFVEDYIDDTRWWKIEINPATICGYTMPFLGYVNTLNYTMYSDAIMSSYKYRHYLFGVQYDEYNKRKNYIYAVPGNKNEQPDKGHTGFTVYQPCDNRNDSLGYWLCFIDSRTRRIIK